MNRWSQAGRESNRCPSALTHARHVLRLPRHLIPVADPRPYHGSWIEPPWLLKLQLLLQIAPETTFGNTLTVRRTANGTPIRRSARRLLSASSARMDRYVTTRRPRSISRSCDRLASSPVRVRSAEPQLAPPLPRYRPGMDVIGWLLESDPAVRWQVLRDLTDAPPAVVPANGRASRPRAGAPGYSRSATGTGSGPAGRVSRRTSR